MTLWKFFVWMSVLTLATIIGLFHYQDWILSSGKTLCQDLEKSARESEDGISNLLTFGETVVDEGLYSGVYGAEKELVARPVGEIRLSRVYVNGDACVFEMERDVKPVEKSKVEKTLKEIDESIERIRKALGNSEVGDYGNSTETASGSETVESGDSTDSVKTVVKYAGAVPVHKAKFYARWIREIAERKKERREFTEDVKRSLSE